MIQKLLVIFLVCITANFLTGTLLKKENEWTYKQSYLQVVDYPHDWYLVGSSRTRMGISSQLLCKELNQRVYNLSCSSFFMPSNWAQLESFLGLVTRKRLIVELAYNITSVNYYPTIASRWEYLLNYYESERVDNNYSLRYTRNIIKNLLRPSFTPMDLIPGELQKEKLQAGFNKWGEGTDPIFQLTHRPTQNTNLHNRSEKLRNNYTIVLGTGKRNDYYLDRLQHLITTAHQNDNEIYFYIPTTLNETEAQMLASVWPYIPLSNRILTYEDPRFYQLMNENLLFDEGHLNKVGSGLLTDIIIQQLRHKNVIPSSNKEPTASPAASPQK